jgi:hypothetical protein
MLLAKILPAYYMNIRREVIFSFYKVYFAPKFKYI